jgi:tetratricopeptide (TPR) repeat protein
LQLGRPDDAITSLQKALALDPKLQGAQLTLVHALSESGRTLEAEGAMQAFLHADPARELIAQAAAHQRAGRLEEAEAAYREVLRRDPRNIEALTSRRVAVQTEHYGQAEQLLLRAVGVAPDFLAAWIELSRTQLSGSICRLRARHCRAARLNPARRMCRCMRRTRRDPAGTRRSRLSPGNRD